MDILNIQRIKLENTTKSQDKKAVSGWAQTKVRVSP
jgi:hypothetical protein